MADIGLIAVKSKHLMKRMDLIMKYNADYYEKKKLLIIKGSN